MERKMRPEFFRSVLWGFVAGCAVLALAGCEATGTLSGVRQSCSSSSGFLDAKKVSCTGSVDTVGGSPSLSVIKTGEDLDGAFRLEVDVKVGRGTAKARVTETDDERVGGAVSPGKPLRIDAVVYPDSAAGTDEGAEVDVQLEVSKGEEVGDLRYEAKLTQRD